MKRPTLTLIEGYRDRLLSYSQELMVNYIMNGDAESLRELSALDARLAHRPQLSVVASNPQPRQMRRRG